MSQPRLDRREIAQLRAKINEAKRRLPLPRLLEELGLAAHAKKTALCPLHGDKYPSFSVFQGEDSMWHWKCFAGCGQGDEIMFVRKLNGFSMAEAMNIYLTMAGFPASAPHESHECLECPKSPEPPTSPEFPVSPVSEGQDAEAKLKALAAQNACTQPNTARPRRFKLLRDLNALQKQIGRKLQSAELATAFYEWHRVSLAFLDPAKTREDYEAKFFSEFAKVRFGTGEGTLATALENVAKLSQDQLVVIPGKPIAPESWRRLATFHHELARLRRKPTYFLSYRDAAKVFDGMTHQQAFDITGALFTLGVIDFLSKGKAGLNSRKAAEFRNLWHERSQNFCDSGRGRDHYSISRLRQD